MAGPMAKIETLDYGSKLDDEATTTVTITVRGRNAPTLLSQELDNNLRTWFGRVGFPQPNEVIEQARAPTPDWVVIAPGVVVRSEEYQVRFGDLDLDQLKKRMAPELYLAFVRHIGAIKSLPDIDVNDLIERRSN